GTGAASTTGQAGGCASRGLDPSLAERGNLAGRRAVPGVVRVQPATPGGLCLHAQSRRLHQRDSSHLRFERWGRLLDAPQYAPQPVADGRYHPRRGGLTSRPVRRDTEGARVPLNELKTVDFFSPATMTLQASRADIDQPFVRATEVASADRVYVGL